MKLILLLVGAQLASSQYGPLPARKTSRPIPDSVNEIVPPDNPQDHGLNGLAPGVNPLNKATNFWWNGPNSPFKPGASSGPPGVVQPGNVPASGCPPGGCGPPPPCNGSPGCTPSQLPGNLPAGSNPFLGQGYGPRPGGQSPSTGNPQPGGGSPPSSGTPPQSSSQTINKPIDISSNPFLSSALQKPIPSSPDSCTAANTYCVPPNICYNGLISDNRPNIQLIYKKGPCSGNEVCCRANNQPSGSGSFPSGQPGSQYPGQVGTQYPGSQTGSNLPNQPQPGSQFPGGQSPSAQPGSYFPGGQSPSAQPGSQFPGGQSPSTQPGSQFPGGQSPSTPPGSQFPGGHSPSTQPGSHFPGSSFGGHSPSTQPGSQYPSSYPGNPNQPGSQGQPGSQFPGPQPQPGSQYPGFQQPGSQSPNTQPGAQFPGTPSGGQSPNTQPGSQYPGQPGSQFPGTQPGSQFPASGSNYGSQNQVNKYTGPLNTATPTECAAALKCVAEIYCTAEGVMSNTPVQLTREQYENKVPLTDCQDPDSGVIGKCCRDPNYKDPWPAGMMMAKSQFDDGLYKGDSQNFDNGQYRPEHQGSAQPGYQSPTSIPNRTIKQPLGVFNTVVTPFPAALKPQPGQTHSQVFPQNQDRSSQGGIGVQPGSSQINPGSYQQPGQVGIVSQGQPGFVPPGQPGIVSPGQPGYVSPGQPGLVSPGQPGYVSPGQSGSFPGSGQTQPNQPVSFHPGTSVVTSGQPSSQYPSQPGAISSSPAFGGQPGQPSAGSPQQFPGQLTPQNQPGQQIPQGGFQQPQPLPGSTSYGSNPAQKPFPPPFPGTPLSPHHTSPSQQVPQVVPGQECGVRRQPYSDNVDVNTANGEFPWQSIVLSSSNRSALCSGALISDNAILTSAHCLQGFDAKDLQVKVGTYTLNDSGKTQVNNVAAIVPHPSYDSGSLAKDQAVLALEQPIVLDQNVDKVCLPSADNERYTQNGKTCFITGWGRPNLQGGLPGTVLHKIEVDLVPSAQCENILKQTYLGKNFILNDGFTCAQPKYGGDFCKVDIGSPLVCDRGDGHYEIVGVYSWDTQCSSQAPAVIAECDTQWTQQVLNTPINTLKAQQNRPRFETSRPEDIDQKPGFALGYGK